uniref:Predicted protein n=1 Tax=Hordeum vulgare subsp. vulgare TaxID=112509 RepID=F2EH09_HORVV|nr:predicted protein [Hordeum vulgare subsp. vulgare]
MGWRGRWHRQQLDWVGGVASGCSSVQHTGASATNKWRAMSFGPPR